MLSIHCNTALNHEQIGKKKRITKIKAFIYKYN